MRTHQNSGYDPGRTTRLAPAGWESVPELGDFRLGTKRETSKVHYQNALGITGILDTSKHEGRGDKGTRKRESFSDENALRQHAVCF